VGEEFELFFRGDVEAVGFHSCCLVSRFVVFVQSFRQRTPTGLV
jgi:hypothetical protein